MKRRAMRDAPDETLIGEMAAQMTKRFVDEMQLDNVHPRIATVAAVIFAARIAATTAVWAEPNPSREESIKTLADMFVRNATAMMVE